MASQTASVCGFNERQDCKWCIPRRSTHTLPRRSLLSKCLTTSRYPHQCNIAQAHKCAVFPAPNFTTLLLLFRKWSVWSQAYTRTYAFTSHTGELHLFAGNRKRGTNLQISKHLVSVQRGNFRILPAIAYVELYLHFSTEFHKFALCRQRAS